MAISIRRRELVLALGGVAATWPLAARAQQAGAVPRIGVVYPGPQAGAPPRIQAVLDGLRAGGHSQVEIVLRVADGDPSRISPLVTEVIASKVDVLFAIGPAVVQAARSATQTLPIVANDLESDPVDTGWAASLAHPGGNITGVFMAFPDFATKWLGLLKETNSQLSRIAILWDPSAGLFQKQAIEAAAKASKVTLETMEVRTPSDLDGAFNSAKRGGAEAVIMLSSPLISANVRKEAELAILHNLPVITLFPDFARAGGLMAYGPNLLGAIRDAGGMIAKVLQGRKPADLPIQRPTKFELVINLKTAKALGLTLPNTLLALADEVIE
ncbi:MAG: ABC transporter substrate-binding protein [Xanthobacteraceae bacterium]|jgi:putative tryptophan/tyrosine transport system substrate-binding protein